VGSRHPDTTIFGWEWTHNRTAAFDVTGRKRSAIPSVIFCFTHKNTRHCDLRNASSSEV